MSLSWSKPGIVFLFSQSKTYCLNDGFCLCCHFKSILFSLCSVTYHLKTSKHTPFLDLGTYHSFCLQCLFRCLSPFFHFSPQMLWLPNGEYQATPCYFPLPCFAIAWIFLLIVIYFICIRIFNFKKFSYLSVSIYVCVFYLFYFYFF